LVKQDASCTNSLPVDDQAAQADDIAGSGVASPQDAAEGLDTLELAADVYFGRGWRTFANMVAPKEQVAVRRALAGLAREVLVFRLGLFRGRLCLAGGCACTSLTQK